MGKYTLNFTQKCDDWYEGGFKSNGTGCRICSLHERCQVDINRYAELQGELERTYRKTYKLTIELEKLREIKITKEI